MYSRLQYISQGATEQEQLYNITEALSAGCKWIQLRFKNKPKNELAQFAVKVKKLCEENNAIFIINDFPHTAEKLNANGLHLGLNDTPVSEARKIIGKKIIGGSANTLNDVLKRLDEGCDYVGLGPFRYTTTKEKLSNVLGLSGIDKIMTALATREVNIPVYAIGGITLNDIPEILNTGVYGVAISGEITNSNNKTDLIKNINNILYEYA